MVRKNKSLAADAGANRLAATVKESAQQIWLAGLGAFAKAQAEGNKVFDELVKEGEALQSRTRKVAGDKVAEMTGKASGTWDKLEQVFEERVARALGRMGVPTKQEVEALNTRVAELEAAVEKMTALPKAGTKPAAGPAAKSAVTRRARAATERKG